MTGNVYVVSGPSGAGKGSLLARVMQRLDKAWLSISATTRKPRTNETEGLHYYFLSDQEFDRLVSVDGLLEWATVHGQRYGTLRETVNKKLTDGIDVILELDTQGAFQVLEKIPGARLIFIAPPSFEELQSRLSGRGSEDKKSMTLRLECAKEELLCQDKYHKVIVNDDLTKAADELYQYITGK